MKSVLISIRPEWIEKIASGEKTIEVRKSAPKELPFKAYIYCTKDRKNLLPIEHGKVLQKVNFWENTDAYYGFGKVIGEFICDKVDEYKYVYCDHPEIGYPVGYDCGDNWYDIDDEDLQKACLTEEEFKRYGKGKTLYGWHISDLKIYDKPKELSEFYTIDESGSDCCVACVYHETPLDEMPCRTCTSERRYLYRPPQSWQYVEELGE